MKTFQKTMSIFMSSLLIFLFAFQGASICAYDDTPTEYLSWQILLSDLGEQGPEWTVSDFTYDGQTKSVTLTGLLAEMVGEGMISISYSGNSAKDAGTYTAVATLTSDLVSPDEGAYLISHEWKIRKADLSLSGVKWNYTGTPFMYDGTEKTVALTGLPAEVCVASYSGNKATAAGKYTATATLKCSGPENYNLPKVEPLTWEIQKADYDLSGMKWVYFGAFTYDGTEKSVVLTGLPDGVSVTSYSGNRATTAGTYTATATLTCKDTTNHTTQTLTVEPLNWEIKKAKFDMSSARWDYSGTPFVWNGKERTVSVTGLPEGVTVEKMTGYQATEPGTYTAEAVLKWDTVNYEQPSIAPLSWKIVKAKYDMSQVEWAYSGAFIYDGKEKCVELTGVPEGVVITYMNNTATAVGAKYSSAIISGWSDPDHYEKPAFPEGTDMNLLWKIVDNDPFKDRKECDLSGIEYDKVVVAPTTCYKKTGSEWTLSPKQADKQVMMEVMKLEDSAKKELGSADVKGKQVFYAANEDIVKRLNFGVVNTTNECEVFPMKDTNGCLRLNITVPGKEKGEKETGWVNVQTTYEVETSCAKYKAQTTDF